ncbi:unnamed protein product [Mucor circinelloides]
MSDYSFTFNIDRNLVENCKSVSFTVNLNGNEDISSRQRMSQEAHFSLVDSSQTPFFSSAPGPPPTDSSLSVIHVCCGEDDDSDDLDQSDSNTEDINRNDNPMIKMEASSNDDTEANATADDHLNKEEANNDDANVLDGYHVTYIEFSDISEDEEQEGDDKNDVPEEDARSETSNDSYHCTVNSQGEMVWEDSQFYHTRLLRQNCVLPIMNATESSSDTASSIE